MTSGHYRSLTPSSPLQPSGGGGVLEGMSSNAHTAPPATTQDGPGTAVAIHDTPVGPLTLAASEDGLTHVMFRPLRRPAGSASLAAHSWLDLARRELDAYVDGRLGAFTVPADLRRVSPLHRRILDALCAVGYGETVTYGELAATIGLDVNGARQVGGAMARNPVGIIVPCHRVVGAGGALTGYAGGLPAKRWLLDLEARDRTPQLDLRC